MYSRSYCALYKLPSNVVSRVDEWDQVTPALAGEIELFTNARIRTKAVAIRFIRESLHQFSCVGRKRLVNFGLKDSW